MLEELSISMDWTVILAVSLAQIPTADSRWFETTINGFQTILLLSPNTSLSSRAVISHHGEEASTTIAPPSMILLLRMFITRIILGRGQLF